jgi:hypothetical protein
MVHASTAASCSPLTATSAAALSLLHRRHEPPERTPSTGRSPHTWGAEGTATMCVTFALDHGGKALGQTELGYGGSLVTAACLRVHPCLLVQLC